MTLASKRNLFCFEILIGIGLGQVGRDQPESNMIEA